MSAQPYTDAEIAACRTARFMLEPPGAEVAGRLLGTVDALQARLAAAEGLLREAAPLLYAMGFDRKAPEDILARIDAHITPTPTKPEGGEVPRA